MSIFSGFKCARDGVLISPAMLNNHSDGDWRTASLDHKILSGKPTEILRDGICNGLMLRVAAFKQSSFV